MNMNKRSSYLFEKDALSKMRNFIDTTTLFAFDLDGTLAPISSNPSVIGIPHPIKQEFAILNNQAVVAVITGRSRSDALNHLGIAPRYLIGNHGAEGLPGWENQEKDFSRIVNNWQSQLDRLLPIDNRSGIMIENKGLTLSLHYRYVCNIKYAHKIILQVIGKLDPQPRRIGGQFIENIIPMGAPDKGDAIKLLMQESGRQKGFFVGDDETDEDVFRLNDVNIFAIRVGKNISSNARFYLLGQHEIVRLLCEINNILNQTRN